MLLNTGDRVLPVGGSVASNRRNKNMFIAPLILCLGIMLHAHVYMSMASSVQTISPTPVTTPIDIPDLDTNESSVLSQSDTNNATGLVTK